MPLFGREYTVVLDTEIFESVRLDFGNPNLRYLGALVQSGRVHVLLTDVIVEEVKAHIVRESRRLVDQLRPIVRTPLLRAELPTLAEAVTDTAYADAVSKRAIDQFAKLLKDLDAEVIPVEAASVPSVFKAYFANEPPFGSRDKKSEFPDAFSLDAVRSWAQDKKHDVVILSADNDAKAFCSAHPKLTWYGTIPHFLALFPDPKVSAAVNEWLDDHWDDVEEVLSNAAPKWRFDLRNTDGRIRAVRFLQIVQVLDAEVVEVDEAVARVAAEIEIEIEVDIEVPASFRRHVSDPEGWYGIDRGTLTDDFVISLDIAVALGVDLSPAEILEVDLTGGLSWHRIDVPRDWEPS